MFILMTVLVLIMNLINFSRVTAEADSVLDMLSGAPTFFGESSERERLQMPDNFIRKGMSPEVFYESRYFVVMVSSDGTVESDLSRIAAVDEESVEDYVTKALKNGGEHGYIDNYRYQITADKTGTKVIFLDCGRKLDSFASFLHISVVVGLAGCIVVFIAFFFAAGKIVAPMADAFEKQKRFISDAGHEIKTPLTIINANIDLLESEGEREELTDIRQQTKRLTKLTDNLVLLSKMEEDEHTLQKIDFPLSDLVSETAGSFRAPASANDIDFTLSVDGGITLNGSPDAVRQLISILLENAIKYSPRNGNISLTLKTRKKSAVLTVYNTTKEAVKGDDLQNVFDRFYRSDTSRNSETGGHGIGLSIAKAIVEAHGGSIAASTKTGNDFTITVNLPLE